MYQQLIDEFIQREHLPQTYAADARQFFLPLLQGIEEKIDSVIQGKKRRPFTVGINGAQGTGKSTLAELLSSLLRQKNYSVAKLSIDDFYYSKAKRRQLADTIHPLLRSRGVPGTHDVGLALHVLQQLAAAQETDEVRLPRFDKAMDDCLPDEACEQIQGPIDVVILEGWFVSARPQEESALAQPINALEADEDSDGRWRAYVNSQLAADYQALFAQLDTLIMLQAPGFEQVLQWRSLQEEKLRSRADADAVGLMDQQSIERFIQHFERLSRHCLATLPQSADHLFLLDAQHRIHASSIK